MSFVSSPAAHLQSQGYRFRLCTQTETLRSEVFKGTQIDLFFPSVLFYLTHELSVGTDGLARQRCPPVTGTISPHQ